LATRVDTGAEESINVINVHAPSGNSRLTETQRKTLLTNLLQNTSLKDATKTVGHDTSILAGDFNTGEFLLAQIMGAMVLSNVCASRWKAFRQNHGMPGDLGIHIGVRGDVLDNHVEGHDPKHYPYAFRWTHGLLLQTVSPPAAEQWADAAAAEDVATEPAGQDARAVAEAMTQPANAPNSRLAVAEHIAILEQQATRRHLERQGM